ncbi:MAG: STAS domain-containing protein [Actinomycetota bacterium]|nr:STAS domain-containing protein [Actinomycetota bacterium]
MQQFSERRAGETGDVAVITAVGAVDMLTAPQLQDTIDAVVASKPAGLIVDMTAVDFLASAGMQVLMITHNRLGADTRFAVVADGPATSRPLKITGIADYVELFSSLDVALTNFAG